MPERSVVRSAIPDTRGLLGRLVVACAVLAAFTSTWGALNVGAQVADLLLVLALGGVGALVLFSGLRFTLPAWLFVPSVALVLCLLARYMSPVQNRYFSSRLQLPAYEPDSIGKAAFWSIALVGVPLVIVASSALDPRAVKWILMAFLAGATVSAGVAVTDLLGLTHVSTTLGYTSISLRQTGLTNHPNTLGVVCALAAPLAVCFLGTSKRPLIPLLGLLLLFAGAMLSGSRGAQAAVPVATAAAVFFAHDAAKVFRRLAVAVGVSLVVGLIGIWRVNPSAFEELFRFTDATSSSTAGSDSERTVLVTQALNDVVHYPFFGIGIKHITEAHNIYLQVLSAGGLVLALGMAVYWVGALSQAWMLTRRKDPYGPFLMISVAVWLVFGAIQNQLTERMLYYTIGCIVALYVGARQSKEPQPPDVPVPPARAARIT